MLVVDVKINYDIIDTIYIRRTESISYSDDVDKEYEYEVLEPKWDDEFKIWMWEKRLDKNIKCVYGDYKLLLKKVLEEMV